MTLLTQKFVNKAALVKKELLAERPKMAIVPNAPHKEPDEGQDGTG